MDGKGGERWGSCTAERDFWRFPSATCDPLYKTFQAYDGPSGSEAFVTSTIPPSDSVCNEKNIGCAGYYRSYNYTRFDGKISKRVDTLSDTNFTYAPYKFIDETFPDLPVTGVTSEPSLNPENITINPLGAIDHVPTLWKCANIYGDACYYERVAGRAEGCTLTDGTQCLPWQVDTEQQLQQSTIATVESADIANRYWCALPGGAGCFVSGKAVIQQSGNPFEYTDIVEDPPIYAKKVGHSTITDGVSCVVGSWQYGDADLIFLSISYF